MVLPWLCVHVVDVITTVADGITTCQQGEDGYDCDVWQME